MDSLIDWIQLKNWSLWKTSFLHYLVAGLAPFIILSLLFILIIKFVIIFYGYSQYFALSDLTLTITLKHRHISAWIAIFIFFIIFYLGNLASLKSILRKNVLNKISVGVLSAIFLAITMSIFNILALHIVKIKIQDYSPIHFDFDFFFPHILLALIFFLSGLVAFKKSYKEPSL